MTTFTVYLLRDTVRAPDEAISAGAEKHEISDGPSEFGSLYVRPKPPRPPKWAKLFEPYVDPKKLGSVQFSAAAFVVPVRDRFFALTFGQGRFIIRPEAIEERFGLLTTLNLVKEDALRSIDKRTFVDDQNSRVQTSQASAAFAFGVDIERDLIRGIVGYPGDPELGRRMAGADALNVTVDVGVPDLKRLLRRYLKAFESEDYKERFPWIDHVRQLRAKGPAVDGLNQALIERLQEAWKNRGLVDHCWLAIPDILDWSKVHGFKFTRSKKEGMSSDLNLPGLLHSFPEAAPTIDFLRTHHAMAVDEEENVVEQWPLYRCIHCEIEADGRFYVLSAGHWFEVSKEFTDSVETFVSEIPHSTIAFPIYNHDNEDAYNKAVVAESGGAFCLMDKKLLKVGGVYDKVEFCDVYGQEAIVHVKHYGSSAVLGHLFNQGMVSGELLKGHPELVQLANEKLGGDHQLLFETDAPPRDVSPYTIVFAVISQSKKPGLHLPFFAKVVLKAVCTRLGELGYKQVCLAKIECDPQKILTKKVAPVSTKGRRRSRAPEVP